MKPRGVPRVLVAADKFKGSMTSIAVGVAVKRGIQRVSPNLTVDVKPMADGGDGTIAALATVGFCRVPFVLSGGEVTSYARRGNLAVIELATLCGLVRRGSTHPMTASIGEVGRAVHHAIRNGTEKIIIALGGSASTDGGLGLLQELGVRIFDAHGRDVGCGGTVLQSVSGIDTNGLGWFHRAWSSPSPLMY